MFGIKFKKSNKDNVSLKVDDLLVFDEKRISRLNDINIKNYISSNVDFFKKLILTFKDDEFECLFDDDFIKKIGNNYGFIASIISCSSNYKNIICSHPYILDYIDKHSLIRLELNKLDLDFGQRVIDYCYSNNNNKFLYLIGYLNDNIQKELLSSSNIEKFIKLHVDGKFLTSLSYSSINKLLDISYFFDILINLDVEDYNKLINEKNFSFPDNIIYNKKFINKYLDISDLDFLRVSLNNLSVNNYEISEYINNIKKNRVNIFNFVNDDGIYNELYSAYLKKKKLDNYPIEVNDALKKGNLDYLKSYTASSILDNLINIYFKEIGYNFLINVEQILNYIKNTDSSLVSSENLLIYKKIYYFQSLSLDEMKKLYSKLDSLDNPEQIFYDDFNKCKMDCYEKLKGSLVKKKKKINSAVNIHKFEGEDFKILVYKNFDNNFLNKPHFYQDITLSLMGNENFEKTNRFYLGYKDISIKNISYVFASNNDSFDSNFINLIDTPSNLLKNSSVCNICLHDSLKNGLELDRPDYIICFDNVSDEAKEYAKKFNCDILLIMTKFYKKSYIQSESLEYVNVR